MSERAQVERLEMWAMFQLEEGTELSLLREKKLTKIFVPETVQPDFSPVKHEQQTRKDCILIQIFILSSHKLDQGMREIVPYQ